jgi:anti-sigma regulatory factor (Ser/Thr protein kinase)
MSSRRLVPIRKHPAGYRKRLLALRRRRVEPPPPSDLHVDLPMSIDAPQMARGAVVAWARQLPVEPRREDALRLLVSEVVSNAVRHSGAPVDAPIRLAASLVGTDVVVTVADAGTSAFPQMRAPDPLAGGYGLHLIDTEARRWGADRAEGTRVWFCV